MELDEILRAFDKKTREGFQVWQQDLGKGIEGQGAGFSEFLGVLPAFAQDTNKVLKILNSQERATREAIKNTGVVFDALTERGDQLGPVDRQLQRPAARRRPAATTAIRALFRAFPTFIDESNADLEGARGLCRQHRRRCCARCTPAGTQLVQRPGTQLSAIAPDFNEFFIGLNRVIPASVEGPAGVVAVPRRHARTCSAQLDPVLRNFNPFFEYLAMFKREIAAMLANDTAVTQATDQIGQDRVHYLRLTSPVNPEALATYPQRQGWHRGNPYYKPGTYDQLKGGLPVFDPDLLLHERLPDARPVDGQHAGGAPQPHPPVRPEQREHGRAAVPQAEPVHVGGRTTDYPQVTEDPEAEPVADADRFAGRRVPNPTSRRAAICRRNACR